MILQYGPATIGINAYSNLGLLLPVLGRSLQGATARKTFTHGLPVSTRVHGHAVTLAGEQSRRRAHRTD